MRNAIKAIVAKIVASFKRAMKAMKKARKSVANFLKGVLFGPSAQGPPEDGEDFDDELEAEPGMAQQLEPEFGLDAEGLSLEERYSADLLQKMAKTEDHQERLSLRDKMPKRLGDWAYSLNGYERLQIAKASMKDVAMHLRGAATIPHVRAYPLFGEIKEPKIEINRLKPQLSGPAPRKALGFDGFGPGDEMSGPIIDITPNGPTGPKGGFGRSIPFQPKARFSERVGLAMKMDPEFERGSWQSEPAPEYGNNVVSLRPPASMMRRARGLH